MPQPPHRILRRRVVLFLAVLGLSAVSNLLAKPAAEESYHIGSEDVLEVTVWQSPDLTKSVVVNSKGMINYAFLGDIPVAGRTPQEVEMLLKEKLAQGYVKNPQLSVTVKEYNSKKILVFGEAVKPGLYKLKGELPLLEVLFMVGGVSPNSKRMTIIRPVLASESSSSPVGTLSSKDFDKSEGANVIDVNLISLLSKGDLSQNVMVKPGDTIYISSGTGERFYVLGQVKNPGPYEWVQDITVLEAIKMASGATDKAALNRIMIRKQGRKEDVIKLNVVDIMRGKKKDDVIIKPGDVIVVPESWI